MKAVIYESIPDCAREIRKKVFTEEQGFQNEFDETDLTATHIVAYDRDGLPVATCRVFWDAAMDSYLLGRLAVLKEYRGQDIGSMMIREAEQYVRAKKGGCLMLHAQCRVSDFYRKSGFVEFGEIGDEEGCPHIWMRKNLA
ncbi:MAG: GNAT family N-acetyltransferase [Lachnospiraceae bacterium]|nr:GNAT family N-acetyltransferase [Lachnospiraceae bacterium]MCM1238973.1 GNAT family N-acetyltransferase [Lachnospiraceae bacterium]